VKLVDIRRISPVVPEAGGAEFAARPRP
jgi:hypothetical protein